MPEEFVKVGHLKDAAAFQARLRELGLGLPCDERVMSAVDGSPLAEPYDVPGFGRVGNRWCIHPMEGWDGTTTGEPSEHTVRRWRNFGLSGAQLIWGGEAFAVQGDGRANPNQLALVDGDTERARRGLTVLLDAVTSAHREAFGSSEDLLVGLQLTHSGRFSRPRDKKRLEPRIAYHHPLLDAKFGIKADDESVVLSDDEIKRLIDSYVVAAKLAQQVGFGFVDVKQCHGYLGHEFLSARARPGPYGGSFENRTRFAREIIGRIKAECPRMMVAVRLSAFDLAPFRPDPSRGGNGKLGPGIAEDVATPYLWGFGCSESNPLELDLTEPIRWINELADMGIRLINASCGSPYCNPHIQRPAMFPPSDGYQPPEDPLVGVARQIDAVRQLKAACRKSIFVGTGYTYLQEYLPHVAQAVVRENWTDFVGLGRLVLSYWDMPSDVLAGKGMQGRRICRTFSDCTTAPRNGIISGCYPLDPHYKDAPEHAELKIAKTEWRKRLTVVKH
ncbi:MAG TPA: hypothetical protein VF669_11870 [Tepidisphaeraceae bacterium]|jgi:2,4-dienoyl-CoA reductase-like NADH-dependent reductase (Old Yellow Enzyme family)